MNEQVRTKELIISGILKIYVITIELKLVRIYVKSQEKHRHRNIYIYTEVK